MLPACDRKENIKSSGDDTQGIKKQLLEGADTLEKSKELYFQNGLTITGLGVNYSGDVTKKTDNFFWPAIQKMTGVDLDIFWAEEDARKCLAAGMSAHLAKPIHIVKIKQTLMEMLPEKRMKINGCFPGYQL